MYPFCHRLIHAYQTHVVYTPIVNHLMIIHHVAVYRISLVHHQIVVQNVTIISIVRILKHVYEIDVPIPVRVYVECPHIALFTIINPFVHAWMVILETRLPDVIPGQYNVIFSFIP